MTKAKSSHTALVWLALACLAGLSGGTAAFEEGKTYKYSIHGSILTKFDNDKPQYSGIALGYQILVQRSSKDRLIVKVEDPQIATFNDVVEEMHKMRPQYKPMENSAGLDKPFGIDFDSSGAVLAFDQTPSEPKWVSNMKRGLLSFFQLRLEQKDASANEYYTTKESCVLGECDTDYLVRPAGDGVHLNVTKTRDASKCKGRFEHRFAPADQSECYDEKDLQQFRHSNAIFNYLLKGNQKAGYLIEQVLLDEVATFSPFTQGGLSQLVQSKFLMKLAEVRESGELAAPSGAASSRALAYDSPEEYSFYAPVDLNAAHHLAHIYQARATVDQVMVAFDALLDELKAHVDSSESATDKTVMKNSLVGRLFMRLDELVGTLDYQSIQDLYTKVDERGDAHKRIFWDLMSVVGTNPSFVFMRKIITDGDAPAVRIKEFLKRSSYHLKVANKRLFDEYLALCKADKIQSNAANKRLCQLPLASLIHQHCAKPHARYLRKQAEGKSMAHLKRPETSCQISTAEEYFSELVGGAPVADDSAATIGDKMLAIYTAGELGVLPTIDYLRQFIARPDEHPSVRAAAMWAMRGVAHLYPVQAKRLAVPYFFDTSELIELRIAAFYTWLNAGMRLHELEGVAKSLMREPNMQLVGYLHSILESLSKVQVSLPCSQGIEKSARLVLPAVTRALRKHSKASFGESRASFSSNWLADFNAGSASLASVIYSNSSLTPTHLFYVNNDFMNGVKISPVSVTVHAHGLDKLVKRVYGMLESKASFMDLFEVKAHKRQRRQATNAELDHVYLALVIKVYGRIVTFMDRDSRELKKMLGEDGSIKVPHIKKLLHTFNKHTSQEIMIPFQQLELINSEIGFPVYQSMYLFAYKMFKLNTINVDILPGFFRDERKGEAPTKYLVELDAKLLKHQEFFSATGSLAVGSFQKIGTGFSTKRIMNIPLNMSLEVDIVNSRVVLNREVIHNDIIYLKQEPFTFARNLHPSAPARFEQDLRKPLFAWDDRSAMEPFKFEYMTPIALGLRVQGRHRAEGDWSLTAWRRYLVEQGWPKAKFMFMFAPSMAPMEASVSSLTTDENPTRKLSLVLAWRHFHSAAANSSPPMNYIERDLESHTGAKAYRDLGRPTTVGYSLTLLGGSEKQREVVLNLTYSRSFNRVLHKWRAAYQRTPLEQRAAQTTNLCWLGSMQFPDYDVAKLLRFEFEALDRSASMTSELTFGNTCHSLEGQSDEKARLVGKGTFDWTADHRAMIQLALGRREALDAHNDRVYEHSNLITSYQKCLRNREQTGNEKDEACLQLIKRFTEFNHATGTFDYKDVPQRWIRMAKLVGSFYNVVRLGYIDEIEDHDHRHLAAEAPGGMSRSYVEANMTSENVCDRSISYEFDTPDYHVVYKNLPVHFPPVSAYPHTQLRTSNASTEFGSTSAWLSNRFQSWWLSRQ